MRTARIIRLVCWSLVAVFLTGVLVYSLAGNGWGGWSGWGDWSEFPDFEIIDIGSSYAGRPDPSNGYSALLDKGYSLSFEEQIDPAGVDSINIDWIAGGVCVYPYNGEKIQIRQYVRNASDKNTTTYGVSSGTLSIRAMPRTSFVFWGRNNIKVVYLEVWVPSSLAQNLDRLTVDGTSANLSVRGLSVGSVNIDSVSGDINVEDLPAVKTLNIGAVSGDMNISNVSAERVSLDSVSGRMDVSGSVDRISANTTSGDINISSAVCPYSVDIDTVSGSTTLSIPENDGFTVKYSKISGSFDCEFSTSSSGGTHTYNGGGASFNMDTVSGSVRIKKLG